MTTLYNHYRTILFGLLVRILRDRAEAEDVLQEVFVQVWQRANDFDEQRGKVFTWLVTLTRNRGLDRLRALKSRTRVIKEASHESFRLGSDVIENVIHKGRSNFVQAALNELSKKERNLLLMAYFEGFSQSEIAARTNTPLGTVKTRMRTAMTKLRKTLNTDLRNWL